MPLFLAEALAHRSALLATVMSLLASGCMRMATPRIEDAAAPRDAYAQIKRGTGESECDKQISLWRSEAEVVRHFEQVATISSTCSPGAPSVCEQHLRKRACELEADAVLLGESNSGSSPWGGSSRSLVSLSGRAIRWLD